MKLASSEFAVVGVNASAVNARAVSERAKSTPVAMIVLQQEEN